MKRRKRSLQKLSRILKSLGFGLGLETFTKFWRVLVSVLVSENLDSEKSNGFGFGEFGLGKKVSVLVLENLVSEKSLGFGEFGLGKKSRFRKIWSRIKVSVSENLV